MKMPGKLRLPRWEKGSVQPGDAALILLMGLVALVGALSAFGVRLFEGAIDLLLELGYHRFPDYLSSHGMPSWSAFILYPMLLGLVVAGVKLLVPKADRAHSVPLVMVSLVKGEGRIRPISTVLKTVASILTLGAGGSLGREGPVVLLGGGLGSAIGQVVPIPANWRNTLVAAGAGAAIATAFHAPITGTFFALEIVLIQFSASSFALVALACVTATEVSRLLEGAPPFPIPAYQMQSSWEIPLFLLLGLVIAPVSRAYVKVLYGGEDIGKALKFLPAWLKPALGGALFGAVAIFLPRTLGGGYDTISLALVGSFSLGTLLLLLAGKFLTIGLTSGGGWPGGVFTPALFLGAMAGGAYGSIVAHLLPGVITQPGIFAVVGMAAMIAGATHAPMTAMTLIFEVTRDYRIALPAMLACGMATVFSQRLSPYSIDTIHLADSGVLLPWQIHDLRSVPVGEVMSRAVHTVSSRMQLKDVIEVMQNTRHGGFPVLDEEYRLVGLVTLRDVRTVPLDQRLTTPVTAVMGKDLAVVTPDESMAQAAMLMAHRGVGRLPVVDPDDRTRLVGIISRSDILRAYPNDEETAEMEQEAFRER